jgi:hypothetical protein
MLAPEVTMSLFEEDPAADFLSREQEAIGDVLGGDNFELIADSPAPAADQGLGELSTGTWRLYVMVNFESVEKRDFCAFLPQRDRDNT